MSQAELNANDLTAIGVGICRIAMPDRCTVLTYRDYLRELHLRLDRAGFTNTIHAVASLLDDVQSIARVIDGDYDVRYEMKMVEFAGRAKTINDVLLGEGMSKGIILIDAKPSCALGTLKNLQPRQELLLRDLVICLKAHLARPAIITAWALGYDIVRWWIYDDANNHSRLTDFNKHSGQCVKNYDEFFQINERQVLETCRKSQNTLARFTEKTHSTLVHLLNDRNRFAHANDSDATISRANVYVEEIVEAVTGPPFNT